MPKTLVAGLYVLALLGTSSSTQAQVFVLQGEKGDPGQCPATCLTQDTLQQLSLAKQAIFQQVSWDAPSSGELAVLGSLQVDLPQGRFLVLVLYHTAGATQQDSVYEFQLSVDGVAAGSPATIGQPGAWPGFYGHALTFTVLPLQAGSHPITLSGRHTAGQGQLTGGAYVAVIEL